MSISVKNVSKKFGQFTALDKVSLNIPDGDLVALLGPSGSGKTTLLRIIAGLENPDEGSVLHRDEEVTSKSAKDRNVGFVFQHYALFRHLTVFDNIGFGLSVRGVPKEKIASRVRELLHLIRLEGLEKRYPSQLSGGQRQRVALARALAAQPRVLLLDEPFGALDAKVRLELREWLRRLHDEIHVTSIFVTHDQEEAFAVADTVVVMRNGKIEQIGTPADVFENPANAFVMDFLGQVNVFQGIIADGLPKITGFSSSKGPPEKDFCSNTIYVRPYELEIEIMPSASDSLPAKVLHVNPAGPVVRIHLQDLESTSRVFVEVNFAKFKELGISTGQKVFIQPKRVRIFAPDYMI
ncbi:sulfate ABC transporter ATP-binding protein [bacterium]|jgi:sulfate transport system ATP-binding protein|nr:sulfate ABC transporter ATP-binding protein [bacterium]